MNMSRVACSLIAGLLLSPMAMAQTDPGTTVPGSIEELNALLTAEGASMYDKNHADLIKSAEVIGALGPDMFGEEVNFYTGSTSFSHTDLVLPSNGGMPLSVTRKFEVEGEKEDQFAYMMGEWDLDLPYIGGVFGADQGWLVEMGLSGSNQRCSGPTNLQEARPRGILVGNPATAFEFKEFWKGYGMNIPGNGMQQVLFRDNPAVPVPTDGLDYRWITNSFWHISCGDLAPAQSHLGEGFVALSPDGTRYYFRWMVELPERGLGKSGAADQTAPISNWVTAERKEIRIYATRVEDRFGNSIDYHWDASGLQSISSSDGGTLSFQHRSNGGQIEQVTDGTRTVHYVYVGKTLREVIYPDQSKWILNLDQVYAPHFRDCSDPEFDPGPRPTDPEELLEWQFQCWDPASPDYAIKRYLSNIPASGTVTHPSGETATFTFAYKRHTRASVLPIGDHCYTRTHPGIPGMVDLGQVGEGEPWDETCWTPRNFDVLAITQKSIGGATLGGPLVWKYEYEVYNPDPATFPPGDYALHTRKVIVKEPGDIRREFNFGNRYNVNEGQLLRLDTYRGHEGGTLVHSTINTYVLKEDIAPPTYQFPPRVGTNPLWTTDNIWAEWLLPMTSESTRQDQVTYTNTQEQFDQFAKPLRVRSWNELGMSRTDITEYHHDLQHWVLGQVRRVENLETGREVSLTEYDSVTALPYAQSSFGRVPETLAYHTTAPMKGRLRTATDGRGLTTTLTDYVRGVPQRIEFSDNTAITAVVDPLGRIIQTTDAMNVANQFTTYGYDLMGRLTSVQYPQNGAPWTPRSLLFAPAVGTQPYQLPDGLWKHTITTGNAVTSTYYDQMWRPILISTEDVGDPDSRSLVVKRYDVRGREVFTSYPVNGAGGFDFSLDLDGVHTEYDDLDRVTKVTTDGEPEVGLLETRTEYLSGLRTRVTNPRGKVTTTTYQAYGAPSYDSPILIQAPEGVTTMIERDIFGKPLKVTRTGPVGLHQ